MCIMLLGVHGELNHGCDMVPGQNLRDKGYFILVLKSLSIK